FGYDHNFLKEESHPTKEVLNQVSTEHPIFISHVSGHVGCANDAALEMAGIDANTPDKEGGVIGRIKGTDEPNGYLEEGSMTAIQILIFTIIELDHVKLELLGQDIYSKNRISTEQDGSTSHNLFDLFKNVAEENQVKNDIVAYTTVADNPEDMQQN